MYLGEQVDDELNGQEHVNAQGDDFYNMDDEDGVEFLTPLIPGEPAEILVRPSTRGFLSAWIDMNMDGHWYEPHDQILHSIELPAGEFHLGFMVHEDAVPGNTVARFRFSREEDVWFNGFAMDGEVEDYVVTFVEDTGVEKENSQQPTEYRLYNNYPNPFNPTTSIMYDLPYQANVVMEIYNIMGKKVKTLIEGLQPPGKHTVVWDATDRNGVQVTTGIYLCRLRTPGFQETIRLVLIK